MELTSVGLLSNLLSQLYTPPSLMIRLQEHPKLAPVAKEVISPHAPSEQVFHEVAAALLRHDLVPDPLLPCLREEFPYRFDDFDAFLCSFAVQETEHLLARVGPDPLSEWARCEAPGPLERRLRDKPKDALTIATQLPGLLQRERAEALQSAMELWPAHTVEITTLRQLVRLWGKVPNPPQINSDDPDNGGGEVDESSREWIPTNDLHHFTITLDRALVWERLVSRCAEPTHQLLVVRGDPTQNLQLFRARVQRYLSEKRRPHIVCNFGPGADHRPATTVAAWEELLVERLGPTHYTLRRALREVTTRCAVMCVVGLNSPLHLGDDSLSADDLAALVQFIRSLPGRLPLIDDRNPRPVRLLLPVQVDPRLGRLDPVFRALQEAAQDAERAAQTLSVPIPVKAELIGILDTPLFSELEEPIETRAWRRYHRRLTETEWRQIHEAYHRAVGARLAFVELARALWDALPSWMKEPE